MSFTSIIRSFRALARAIVFVGTAVHGVLAGAGLACAQAPATPLDQKYQETDPALYAIARKYFPSDVNEVSPKRIFRLTRDQLDATVATLLPRHFAKSIKETMPRDPLQTNYEYAEILSFNPANITALTTWVRDIAARVEKNPAGVIDCPAASATTECHEAAARAFVIRAFRGDVSEERLGEIVKFYLTRARDAGPSQAAAELVEVVLNSPGFLFRKELDLDNSHRLAPPQLLQALTYTIADAPPEKLKMQSESASQYLQSGTSARATLTVIASSGEAREKLVRFFMSWLEVSEPGDFTISREVFPEFTPKFAGSMVADTTQFLRTQLAKPAPRLRDITQAIQLPGAKAGTGSAVAPVALASSGTADASNTGAQRFGILSDPAVIASHSGPTNTRPIRRGVFWARKVLCMEMEPPPPELHAKLHQMTGATERQRIEKTTRQAACIGCHKIINPLGFFLESYDALGRWRTLDNGQPIDPVIDINFLDEGPSSAENPIEALKIFTSSLMFKQCFVRQLFRFYVGRQEEAGDDPLLRRLFFEFAHNDKQDILAVIQMLASSNRLVRRQ